MNERQNDTHRIVKVSKHFFKVSNSDSNDYSNSTHNPGLSRITFNNPGITNVQSSMDTTTTRLNPISFTIDLYYNNVSEAFKNNRFHVVTNVYDVNGLGALSQGGVREGTAGFMPTVVLNDGIYKTGDDMGQELLRALNSAAISWHGGAQLVWTGTGFNANSSSMKFRVATAAPGPPVTNPQKAVFDLVILCNLDLNGLNYDASRVLGLNTTRLLFLPYDASQSANGVLSPAFVDLQTIQVLQLRSNIAKRFFQKQGPGSSTQKPLSLTNILFEIPTEPGALGSTLTWFPADSRYEQEINSNFDEFNVQLTDKNGNTIPFLYSAEWNFNFSVSRDVITMSNEDRVKAMMDYNQFKSF